MNLFSLFKSKSFFLHLSFLLIVLSYVLFTYGADPVFFIAFVLFLIIPISDHITKEKQNKLHLQVQYLAEKLEKGELNERITNLNKHNVSFDTANALNNALDQVETFMREVNTCFTYAQQHIYYRSPLTQGLNGKFSDTLNSITFSFDILKQRNSEQHVTNLFTKLSDTKTSHLLHNLESSQSDIAIVNNELTTVETATKKCGK